MINRKLQLGISFFVTQLLFMLCFRKVDEAWNNRRFLLFIEEIHINTNKSEESIQNPRIDLQLKKVKWKFSCMQLLQTHITLWQENTYSSVLISVSITWRMLYQLELDYRKKIRLNLRINGMSPEGNLKFVYLRKINLYSLQEIILCTVSLWRYTSYEIM